VKLRTIKFSLATLCFIVALSSCQKEINYALPNASPVPGNNIIGDYDFVGLMAHTESTVTITDQGQTIKAVTLSDYVTKNNVGTVKITSNQFIGNGVGYSIDTSMNVTTYINNILTEQMNVPFVATVPPANTISPYIQITADSMTVTGDFGALPDPSGNVPTGPIGLKLSWSGDTLFLKVNSTFTQAVTQNGVPGVSTVTAVGVTKLKKR
jgi:hypothetical protein